MCLPKNRAHRAIQNNVLKVESEKAQLGKMSLDLKVCRSMRRHRGREPSNKPPVYFKSLKTDFCKTCSIICEFCEKTESTARLKVFCLAKKTQV